MYNIQDRLIHMGLLFTIAYNIDFNTIKWHFSPNSMSTSLLLKARSYISPSALVTNTNTMLVTQLTFKATSLQIFLVCFLYGKTCHCSLLRCFFIKKT